MSVSQLTTEQQAGVDALAETLRGLTDRRLALEARKAEIRALMAAQNAEIKVCPIEDVNGHLEECQRLGHLLTETLIDLGRMGVWA